MTTRPQVVCVFKAKFEGTCPECGHDIEPDDRVAELTNGTYIHEACA